MIHIKIHVGCEGEGKMTATIEWPEDPSADLVGLTIANVLLAVSGELIGSVTEVLAEAMSRTAEGRYEIEEMYESRRELEGAATRYLEELARQRADYA